MKIACIGGGPASLYFAILLKKRRPDVEIDVFEQNKADDTFGWGVVFSDETLGNFEAADPESYLRIRERFAYWTDIDTHFRDFDDFWAPFLGAQGPAPTYVQSLGDAAQDRLRDRLRETLPAAANGSIPMTARAWAAKGRRA